MTTDMTTTPETNDDEETLSESWNGGFETGMSDDEWLGTNDWHHGEQRKEGKVVMIPLLQGPDVPCKAPVKVSPLSVCAETPVRTLKNMKPEEKIILAAMVIKNGPQP